jgi:nucleoside-diphosphate-sugar epimerase
MVTGASGFVGRHLLPAFLEAGHEVHAVSSRPISVDPDAHLPREDVCWHHADLLDPTAVSSLTARVRPELLVHLAWYGEHGRFWTSPENVRWVESSLALVRAFAAAGGHRAVMAGTCAEYEWSREVYSEDAPQHPATLYGASKHGLHRLAAALAEQVGLSLVWARLFFLYGPFEAPERFVASLVRALLAREPAPLTAGTQRRDFLHTADAAAAFAALAQSQVVGAVNVASGTGVALREIAERIAERTGGEELLQIGARPMPSEEPPALVADVGRLRDEVGWRPQIGLEDGLDGVIAWWRERMVGQAIGR